MSSIDAKSLVLTLLSGSKATTGYYGLSDAVANTDGLFDEILASVDSTTRAERLLKWQELEGDTVPVYGESIRTVMRSPAVYVFRNGFRQDTSPLGFRAGSTELQNSNAGRFQTNFQVRGVTQLRLSLFGNNPQQRDDLFLILKELLYRGVPYFSDNGAKGFMVTNARDGQYVIGEGRGAQILHAADIDVQLLVDTTWSSTEETATAILDEYQITPYSEYLS